MSKDCFNILKQQVGDQFSNEELNAVFEKLQQQKSSAADNASDLHDQLSNAGEEIHGAQELEDARKEFNFYRDLENQNGFLKLAARFKDKNAGLKLAELSWINGTQRGLEGSRDSIRLRMMLLREQLTDSLKSDLEKNGLLSTFNSKEYEEEIANEISAGPTSDDEHVKNIGSIVRKYLDQSAELYKKNGVFIKTLEDRITRNFHVKRKLNYTSESFAERQIDRFKLTEDERKEKSFQRWRETTEPLLDQERTKRGEVPIKDLSENEREQFFRKSYDSLTDNFTLFDKPSGLQKRLNQNRVLQWKDGASMVGYNRVYGVGTIHEAILSEFERTARQVSVLERMGENPENFLKRITKIAREDPDFNMDISNFEFRNVTNTLKVATGATSDPDSSIAQVGGTIRRAIDIGRLGGVVLKVLPDIVPVSMELARFHGSFLKGMHEAITGFAGAKSLTQQKELAGFLKSFSHTEIGMNNRFMTDDVPTGMMSKMHSLAFKLNRLTWWDKGHRVSIAAQAARHLANVRDLSFDDIVNRDKRFGEQNVRILKAYNITSDEWNAFRKVPDTMANGMHYLLPESAQNIPDSEIKSIMQNEGRKRFAQNAIDERRNQIQEKIAGYILDRTDHGIFSPDFNDQAQLLGGTSSGTVHGQLMRFFAQYKMYSMAFMKRSWGQAIYGNGADSFLQGLLTGKGDWAAKSYLMGAGLLSGYISVAAKSIAAGKTPPDPTDPETITESMVNGGVLSMYGDYLLSPQSGPNRSLVSDLAGPAAGELNDLFSIVQSPITRGKPTKMAAKFLENNAKSMTPFYLKYIMDALVFNRMSDAVSPGSTQRQMDRMQKHGQHYFLPPKF